MKSSAVKRSVLIAGHYTSVYLEDAFWNGLREIAKGATRACRTSSPPSTRIGMAAISQQLFVSLSFAIASMDGIG